MGSKAGLYDPNPLIMCQRVSQTFECLFYWLTKPLIWMRKGHRDRETCNWVYEKKSSIQLRRNSKSCQPVRLIWLTAVLSVCLVVLSVHYKDTVCNTRIYNPWYFFALSKLSLYTPAVYLCVSACAGVYVGQTARPLTALSGLPNRLLSVLHCFCLLCKKKKSTVLAAGPFCDSGLWFHSREMMKMQPTLLSFFVCICLCESLRLHLPGSCSQLTENCSPHTHRASPRSLITHSWQFRVCMSCEKTLPASVLEFWRSFWGHQHRLFSLSFFPPCILCFFSTWVALEIVNGRGLLGGVALKLTLWHFAWQPWNGKMVGKEQIRCELFAHVSVCVLAIVWACLALLYKRWYTCIYACLWILKCRQCAKQDKGIIMPQKVQN